MHISTGFPTNRHTGILLVDSLLMFVAASTESTSAGVLQMFDSFAAAAYRRVVKGPLEKHRTEGPAAKDIPSLDDEFVDLTLS